MWLSSRSVSGYSAPRLCTTGTLLTSRQVLWLLLSDLSKRSFKCLGREGGGGRSTWWEQFGWGDCRHFWNYSRRDHLFKEGVLRANKCTQLSPLMPSDCPWSSKVIAFDVKLPSLHSLNNTWMPKSFIFFWFLGLVEIPSTPPFGK